MSSSLQVPRRLLRRWWWAAVACAVVEFASWVYRVALFFMVCVLLRRDGEVEQEEPWRATFFDLLRYSTLARAP
jgi:hypothetical protein